MIAIVLMLLAAEPADAPVCAKLPHGRSLTFEQGDILPFKAQCNDNDEHTRRECWNEYRAGKLESAENYVWLSRGALGVLIGGAAAGLVATVLSIVLLFVR